MAAKKEVVVEKRIKDPVSVDKVASNVISGFQGMCEQRKTVRKDL